MKRFRLIALSILLLSMHLSGQTHRILGDPFDMSIDFTDLQNTHFFADRLADFNPSEATGKIHWVRHNLFVRQAFDINTLLPQPLKMLDFPGDAYINDPDLGFELEFVSERTIRLRIHTSPVETKPFDSPMLAGPVPSDKSWIYSKTETGHRYTSAYGAIEITQAPFCIALFDSQGKRLTDTRSWHDNDSTQVKTLPFNFIKRGEDNSRAINPVFSLSPGEKIFGCGESPTSLNKRGQRIHLFVTDPQGPEGDRMYKPIPFFFSNRGYGMFMHTSAPITCDFGSTYTGSTKLFMGDEELDLFIFLGNPKEVLYEYTAITGRSPVPPLWSFGTWMSRITYFSQDEGYEVARKLRDLNIPADVIHFDTGWFETDWQCDYRFAPSRFSNPQKMIDDLLQDGFHISLWQLPYFTPKNRYYQEIIDRNLHVRSLRGDMPYEDAVLDFSNPECVAWYQEKLGALLKMGVGAIKVDFGEAAPMNAIYASGRSGWYEHNLYPLRYNKAVADITREIHGEHIIWARSAWAGSQRYPLHWGGDAANTDTGMSGTLHAGLSLGLSGFSFWSHDIGGFVQPAPEPLYRRWLPFGFLTSHSRVHGAPPTEPWLYNDNFVKAFKQSAELKYALMPYVYAQAHDCSLRGLPMVRALFVEYPEDPGAWLVEDEYLFGSDILVAPLLEEVSEVDVYLPGKTRWIDYQTGKSYNPGWQRIASGEIPAVILVREGAVIPHAAVASHTALIDWNHIELRVYGSPKKCSCLLVTPYQPLATLTLKKSGKGYTLSNNPFKTTHFTIR